MIAPQDLKDKAGKDIRSCASAQIVAVHQPNYLPWLGYFAKLARADVFVFLDDVQYSKGSFTNRVQIARDENPVWLTVPVRQKLGVAIRDVEISKADWNRGHRDALFQAYRYAAAFREIWPLFEKLFSEADVQRLSVVNMTLIQALARRLGLTARFEKSSDLALPDMEPDARIAAIVSKLAPGGSYLSGSGGAKYQSEDAFRGAGVTLTYSDFKPAPYERSGETFLPGLSIADALFHLGAEKTAQLVRKH